MDQGNHWDNPPTRNKEHTTDPILAMDIEKTSGFDRLPSSHSQARWAMNSIKAGVRVGALHSSQLRRLADFGFGNGGSTFTLTKIAECNGGMVDAFEKAEYATDLVVKFGILPKNHVFLGDGIEHLNHAQERIPEGYDLITAFWLNPDSSGQLFLDLTRAASRSLSPEGHLLITPSSGETKKFIESKAIPYTFIPESGTGDNFMQETLIIPQSSCAALSNL